MTIKAGHLSDQPLSLDIFFLFISVDYQTGLWEKYLVTADWSQSKSVGTHYENRPIQIYWEFYHQKMKTFGWKILVVFIFLLKT